MSLVSVTGVKGTPLKAYYASWRVQSFPGLPQQSTTNQVTQKTEMYGLTVLETRSLKVRCQQGQALSEGPGGESLLVSFSFWCLPAMLGFAWLVHVSLQSDGIFSPCLTVPSGCYNKK